MVKILQTRELAIKRLSGRGEAAYPDVIGRREHSDHVIEELSLLLFDHSSMLICID